jgi:hypothetical protein
MLPLILGIGAAALLLGRKAVKRATRSNPRKRKAVKRRARRNPVEARFRRAGVNVVEVRRYLDGRIKVHYSDGKVKTFRKARKNPVEARFRRAGVNVVEVRRYLDGRIKVHYSDGKVKTFRKARKNPAADTVYFLQNRIAHLRGLIREAPPEDKARLREILKLETDRYHRARLTPRKAMQANPARRRKGKRISPDQAASRLAWWRWPHNPKCRRRCKAHRNPGDVAVLPPTLRQIESDLPKGYAATADRGFAWSMSRRNADAIAKETGWKVMPARLANHYVVRHPEFTYWIS